MTLRPLVGLSGIDARNVTPGLEFQSSFPLRVAANASLSLEMPGDLECSYAANDGLQLVNRGLCNSLDRAKISQQFHLSLFTNARYFRQFRREIAFFAAFAVKFDGGFVRFFANV